MKVSWVIVSYNTREVTLECLRSLENHDKDISQEVIVIDNASKDGSADAIESEFPWVRLIRSTENLGFAKGSNRGMEISRGRFIILLNPDTVVHPGALTHLVDFLESHDEIGMAGGTLLSSQGKIQWSQRFFPSVLRQLSEACYLHYLLPRQSWTGELDKNLDHYRRVSFPDWISGAFLCVRREVYDRIGGLDERYFMYYEDVDWCFECRKRGWQIAFVPESKVTHYGGLSSGQDIGTFYPRLIESQLRFNRKHFSSVKSGILHILIGITTFQRAVALTFLTPFRMMFGKRDTGLLKSRWKGLWVAFRIGTSDSQP